MEVGGVSSQLLRYIEILLVSPWSVALGEESGFPLSPKRTVQIAHPASFLAQKILIHDQRDYRDKAKDLLYMHDTVEVFSENLKELRHIFRKDIVPHLHRRMLCAKVKEFLSQNKIEFVDRNIAVDEALNELDKLAPGSSVTR